MPGTPLKIIVTRQLPEPVETRLSELFDVELNLDDTPMDAAALRKAVERADVLVPTITDKIDASLLSHAGPQLKLIANYGAGFDHIDVQTARGRGLARLTNHFCRPCLQTLTSRCRRRRVPASSTSTATGCARKWAP